MQSVGYAVIGLNKERILARLDQCAVKSGVQLMTLFETHAEGLGGLSHIVDQCLNENFLVVGFRQNLERRRFQHQTHLADRHDFIRVGAKNVGAGLGSYIHKPLHGKRHDRFPYRSPADLQVFRYALLGNLGSKRKSPRGDFLTEHMRHLHPQRRHFHVQNV